MNGEFISIETARIMAEIEKENKTMQEKIDKAIERIESMEKNISNEMLWVVLNNLKIDLLKILKEN